EIKVLLTKTSLLTLIGSGGTGKTRLSLQVAADLVDSHEDGVWLIELAPLSDPGLVPQTVASALGIKEEPGTTMAQTLVKALQPRKMLLLLDNCEHLLEATVHLAGALLKHCPDVKVLTSSREALGVSGEQTYRIPSLDLPPVVRLSEQQKAADLLAYDAVRLFAERCALVKADF